MFERIIKQEIINQIKEQTSEGLDAGNANYEDYSPVRVVLKNIRAELRELRSEKGKLLFDEVYPPRTFWQGIANAMADQWG